MKNLTYTTLTEKYIVSGTEFTAYGIAVYDIPNRSIIASFRDISPDIAEVNKLAELCCTLELDPQQLADVVEDFINSR